MNRSWGRKFYRMIGTCPGLGHATWRIGRIVQVILWVIGGVTLGVTLACGPAKVDRTWIDADSAVLRCVMTDVKHSNSLAWRAIPSPEIPSGFYALDLVPDALVGLGFAANTPVCASLHAPSEDEIDAANLSIRRLIRARGDAERVLSSLDECACDRVYQLGLRGLFRSCDGKPALPQCMHGASSSSDLESLESRLKPLRVALQEARLPRLHWRLSGKTDRYGWVRKHYSGWLARHSGGSEVFLRGAKVKPGRNQELISALLHVEDVSAVIRQDTGRALLVIREISGGAYVFDYFAYPELRGEIHPLYELLDNAQISTLIEKLEQPQESREPIMQPVGGPIMELDFDKLERMDRAWLTAAQVDWGMNKETLPAFEIEGRIIDRVALHLQVPEGNPRVEARLELNDTGIVWASEGKQQELSSQLSALFKLASSGSASSGKGSSVATRQQRARRVDGLLLRSTEISQFWFASAGNFAETLARVNGQVIAPKVERIEVRPREGRSAPLVATALAQPEEALKTGPNTGPVQEPSQRPNQEPDQKPDKIPAMDSAKGDEKVDSPDSRSGENVKVSAEAAMKGTVGDWRVYFPKAWLGRQRAKALMSRRHGPWQELWSNHAYRLRGRLVDLSQAIHLTLEPR